VNKMAYRVYYREGFEFGTSDIQEVIYMGVYEPKGVRETHQTIGGNKIHRLQC